MFFEDLKENYTKVAYRQPVEVKSTGSVSEMKKSSSIPKFLIKMAVAGAIFYFTMDASVFAAGLEEKAEELYFNKFIGIAKWVIITKGGWDIVTKTLKEDFDGAKRSILQYAMIFAVLMGLPTGLNLVEELFREA